MPAPRTFSLTPGKRVLFLTKDPALIRKQLAGELDLRMDDVRAEDLLDDINTDAMTPAWVCFDFDPAAIARNAYAGLVIAGERLLPEDALAQGNFEMIVAGAQKGVGSSRETAAQCEVFAGSRMAIASSFAPIHARNNINIGQLMGDHAMLRRLQAGEEIALAELTAGHDPITAMIIESGGLLPFCARLDRGEVTVPATGTGPRPMNLTEKILAAKLLPGQGSHVKPGDAVLVRVDAGYSHEFTTAQVHHFLAAEYGADYQLKDPSKFAVFEDHLIYADTLPSMRRFKDKIETLRVMQRAFAAHTGVRNYGAVDGISPGICHQIAREQFLDPGDFVQATDSHTCMGGASGALSWGVGSTEYAALAYWGFTPLAVPESIRFELVGRLADDVTAKDVMLHLLATFAKQEQTLNRVMEFGGEGLFALSPDERATLANMATECSARGAVMEVDEVMLAWIKARRPDADLDALRAKIVTPDPGAHHDGGVHVIDLAKIRPMLATPGDPDHGIPPDPKNGALVPEVGRVKLDIAYGGSCTAGKRDDIDHYARVLAEADRAGKRIAEGVRFVLQFGSKDVEDYARKPRPPRAVPPGRRRADRARLRRLHRLRPRRQRPDLAGHGLGHQPQLQGPQRPRPALPGLAAHRRRLGHRGRDRRVPRRHVRQAGRVAAAALPRRPGLARGRDQQVDQALGVLALGHDRAALGDLGRLAGVAAGEDDQPVQHPRPIGADPAVDIGARAVRHEPVDQDRVEVAGLELRDGRAPALHGRDHEAQVAQQRRHDVEQLGLVVGEQQHGMVGVEPGDVGLAELLEPGVAARRDLDHPDQLLELLGAQRQAAPGDHPIEIRRRHVAEEDELAAQVDAVLEHPAIQLTTHAVGGVPRHHDRVDRGVALEDAARLGQRGGRRDARAALGEDVDQPLTLARVIDDDQHSRAPMGGRLLHGLPTISDGSTRRGGRDAPGATVAGPRRSC